jgi:alpha-tubulin suppressor-like RCC1 family protein
LDVVLTGLNPEPVWCQVSVGANHVLALTASGDVWAWGRNNRGQLGIGNQIPQSLPVQVLGLTGVTFISAGANSSACLIGDQLRVWGDNTHGQLALGNTNMQLTPQTVAGNHRTIQVADHTLVINTAGQLFASGRNNAGQLGVGNTTPRTTFAQVGSDSNWTQVAVGSTHSLAIQSSGSMWAWGSNNRGQLGLVNPTGITSWLVPTATGTPQTWNQISAGTEYSLVINSNYALYGAGLNTSGQLGNNTTSNRNVWTQLGLVANSNGLGRKTWAHAFASVLFSMGVNHKGELLTWGITTPFNAATVPQKEPVYLATTPITLSQDVDNSATVYVTDASQVIADSLVKSSLVPMGTRVQSVNLTLNQIILTIPVTLKATTQLTLVYDRWDSDQAVIFDKKSPVIVNGQTYYMLLRD